MRNLRDCFPYEINPQTGGPTNHPIFKDEVRQENRTHAGLWLDKFLVDTDDDRSKEGKKTASRSRLVNEVARLPVPEVYHGFYQRWKMALSVYHQAELREAKVQGRMVVGLGNESVLETAVLLHHTYGVPYIPGSALKGLVSSYLKWRQRELGQPAKDEAKQPGRDRSKEAKQVQAIRETICGETDEAGYILFFDALYQPEEGTQMGPLYPDVMTVHHQSYYQKGGPPADWESPIPVPFLSATSTYLIALAAPDLPQGERAQWIDITFQILEDALVIMGIGAKTSSGYGRMVLGKATQLPAASTDPSVARAEGHKKEVLSLKSTEVVQKIKGYYDHWCKLSSNEAKLILAEAIIEKMQQANYMPKESKRTWYLELRDYIQSQKEAQ